ncbi:MAG: TSUP family transporter [Rhodobacteraceae bacterium]|nr:TSUP family transporter [Paracoccaceae bacterium]
MSGLEWEVIALLIAAGFVAGFIDSIAGGGGLITVPALLLSGADPVTALGTNKVQGLFGSGTAALSYAKAGLVDLRRQAGPALIAFVAAALGAVAVSRLPVDWIDAALPVVLIAIAVFFAVKPGLSDRDGRARLGPRVIALSMVPLVGFYDGLVGPGTGSFFMIGFVTLAGYGVLKATAHTKLLNFASNLGGLMGFLLVGSVWWGVGLLMALGTIAGARVGAGFAQRFGARMIKPLLVLTSTAMALRLLLGA